MLSPAVNIKVRREINETISFQHNILSSALKFKVKKGENSTKFQTYIHNRNSAEGMDTRGYYSVWWLANPKFMK